MFVSRQRMEARLDVLVMATLRFADRVEMVTLTNASTRGVLALFVAPPPRGTLVEIEIDGVTIRGQVRWRGQARCGIALREAIDVEALARGRIVTLEDDGARAAGPAAFLLSLLAKTRGV